MWSDLGKSAYVKIYACVCMWERESLSVISFLLVLHAYQNFSAMKETWDEAEFVLQPPLSQKEIQCAEQVARELELLVEKVSQLLMMK